MAELVYAFDLKSNGENHMGSSPISGTMRLKTHEKRGHCSPNQVPSRAPSFYGVLLDYEYIILW